MIFIIVFIPLPHPIKGEKILKHIRLELIVLHDEATEVNTCSLEMQEDMSAWYFLWNLYYITFTIQKALYR